MWASALIAAVRRRWQSASPDFTAHFPATSADAYGIVPHMLSKRNDGETPNLERRALMYYNRDQKKVARYLSKHAVLKGNCSNADH